MELLIGLTFKFIVIYLPLHASVFDTYFPDIFKMKMRSHLHEFYFLLCINGN